MLQQAVNSGDADVIKLLHAIAHHSRGEHSFLGDRDVTGAGGNDEDGSLPRNFLASFDGDHAGERMKFRSAADALHGGEYFGVGAGDQNVVARCLFPDHFPANLPPPPRRPSFSQNHITLPPPPPPPTVPPAPTDLFEP